MRARLLPLRQWRAVANSSGRRAGSSSSREGKRAETGGENSQSARQLRPRWFSQPSYGSDCACVCLPIRRCIRCLDPSRVPSIRMTRTIAIQQRLAFKSRRAPDRCSCLFLTCAAPCGQHDGGGEWVGELKGRRNGAGGVGLSAVAVESDGVVADGSKKVFSPFAFGFSRPVSEIRMTVTETKAQSERLE